MELILTDLCEIVANFRLSYNVPRPLFQNQCLGFKNLTCNIKTCGNALKLFADVN